MTISVDLHVKHQFTLSTLYPCKTADSFYFILELSMKACLNNEMQLQEIDITLHISRRMGKPTICIGENKGADQLRGNREADRRLCFRYMDSTFTLLPSSKISSF